ncbi:dTDP-4-dehydrorhamnose reductase [Alicyclobacillaceae bacterium I2511]|nr:dTDP-4-dehydrorhamnose reductase [Alicyclobacillaceae bacterium I2511]
MKVLVTGGGGQLGQSLARVLTQTGHHAVVCLHGDLDITDGLAVRQKLAVERPDAVIHAGAYTAVDQAEEQPDQAYRVNVAGTRNVVLAAEAVGARVGYVSTDYVFDGKAHHPYTEFAMPHPLGVYGGTKLAGEQLVQSLSSRWFVVRTAWVYSAVGKNFVKTMLHLGRQGGVVRVVQDQWGSPTYALDLAEFLVQLLTTERYGLYHATNAGVCTWYDFAKEIYTVAGFAVAEDIDAGVLGRVKVQPCTTMDVSRLAPRPAYSVLANLALRAEGFSPLRPWQEALRQCMGELAQTAEFGWLRLNQHG